jgi:hypothetical protein
MRFATRGPIQFALPKADCKRNLEIATPLGTIKRVRCPQLLNYALVSHGKWSNLIDGSYSRDRSFADQIIHHLRDRTIPVSITTYSIAPEKT